MRGGDMKRPWLLVNFLFAVGLVVSGRAVAEDRKVLAELFTSTTCPPCYNADVYYFHSWLPGYADSDRVITIAYHVWWPSPGNDPMYLANMQHVQARVSFCQGSPAYVPRMYVNGTDATSSYATWPGIIANQLTVTSPLRVVLSGVRDSVSMKVSISVTATAAVNSSSWRMHCVVVEDGISQPQNSSGGYVPFVHDYVHRRMYPSADGTPLAIVEGQTVVNDMMISFTQGWKPENCRVVVFVQDISNKAVQQAEEIRVSDMTWGVVAVAEDPLPLQPLLAQNYPNPFNPSTTITYELPGSSMVTLSVYDLLGHEVSVLVNERREAGHHDVRFDASGVAAGVYLYRLQAGGFVQTRKLLLIK
jgi:hypothetical protein